MNWHKRPLAVTILGCLYIVVGVVGFAYHFQEIYATDGLHFDGAWVELVRLLAIVCGAYLLRGHNWARWLAVAWIALHVVVSAFHSAGEFAMHLVFCVVITWFLFRPEVSGYFRGASFAPK